MIFTKCQDLLSFTRFEEIEKGILPELIKEYWFLPNHVLFPKPFFSHSNS